MGIPQRRHGEVCAHGAREEPARLSGAQIPLIAFDELTHFTRPVHVHAEPQPLDVRVRPYMQATCNPVPDDDPVGGWVHELVGWYLDGTVTPFRSVPAWCAGSWW